MMQQFPMTIKNDVTAQKAHLTSYRTWQSRWALPNAEEEPPESLRGACREDQALPSQGCVVGKGQKGRAPQGEFQLHRGNH